jgi:hypothetical protein
LAIIEASEALDNPFDAAADVFQVNVNAITAYFHAECVMYAYLFLSVDKQPAVYHDSTL